MDASVQADARLVEEFRRCSSFGDRERVFTKLAEKYHKPLFYVIRGYIHDFQHAEDCAQNVLIKLWLAMENGKPDDPGKFWSFLKKIAAYTAIDMLRRRKAVYVPLEELCKLVAPGNHVEPIILKDLVLRALEKLPEKNRAVIELYYLEERDENETAELLGISQSEVNKRKNAGLKKLRNLIKDLM